MAWTARSPAPASMARAAFSGDLKQSTEIIDIIYEHYINKCDKIANSITGNSMPRTCLKLTI